MTATAVRVRWIAGRDGMAHAHVSGRTLCHAPSIAERFAWPTVTRCTACVAAVATIEGKANR
jgi:hypothetical protein